MTADFPDPPRAGEPAPANPDGARQPILQVEADIAAANGMEAAREVLLRWLESRSAGGLPQGAWQGEPFTLATPEGRTADIVSRADPPLWAALLTEPAGTPDGPCWTAEASVSYAGDRGRLAVRLGCTGPAGQVVPAVPGFIRTLMRDVGLHRNGRILSAAPTDIDTEEKLDDLIALIEDRRRDLPVIVISGSAPNAPWPLDAADLARRIACLAWVYRLPFELAFGLSDAFTKRWSVFQGATRLYRPGFDRETQTPFDHPLLLPRRPLDPDDDDAVDTLCGEVVRASIAAPGIYRRLPRFETLAAACAPPPREAPAPEPRVEPLTAVLPQAPAPATDAADDAPPAGAPPAGAPRDDAPTDDAQAAPDTRPARYQDLPKWAAAAFADRLVLSVKAQRAARTSAYRDIGTVCDALELLAQHYVDMRRNGGREVFEQSLKTLRLKDESVAANPDRLRKDPQYWCRLDGRPVFIDRHLKKGTSREPRDCLRIYYAWDEDTRRVVVGHLTTHLDSEIT
ncbi:MAG TPA: hypothetical protein VGG99_23375 [Acetobacteraceae bacterium]|jgi:hypothetical protein